MYNFFSFQKIRPWKSRFELGGEDKYYLPLNKLQLMALYIFFS